ncbi:MAG: hypothetical protein UHJ41_03790, partial [Bacteroidaceae bacterium]|nr:hypothetical protein [Bacteroidaceae bacterium]
MNKTFIAVLAALPLFFISCIQEEMENTECDIESISLHLDKPTDFFYHDYDTVQTIISAKTNIVFIIRSYADAHNIPTTLRVTEGASVYLKNEDGIDELFRNGSAVDYSDEKVRRFHIVSEDRVWSRDYTVSVIREKPSEGNLTIGFEEYTLEPGGKYYVWTAPEIFTDGTWKNGNPGFKISKSSAKPMDYPSTPVMGGGPDGSDCLK